jgi:uncharacterized protein YegP (UPF0339 family)
MASEFQLYQDDAGAFRWRLTADNNQVIAVASEGYVNKGAAERGIEIVKLGKADYMVLQDKAGQWRWRSEVTNGNVIATAGQGYVTTRDCERGIQLVRDLARKAPVKEK